jgi:hypothetical protein
VTTIDARVSKARKLHIADCGHNVHPGSLYLRLYGSSEAGDPIGTLKLCVRCIGTVGINNDDNNKVFRAINEHPGLTYDVQGNLTYQYMVDVREVV